MSLSISFLILLFPFLSWLRGTTMSGKKGITCNLSSVNLIFFRSWALSITSTSWFFISIWLSYCRYIVDNLPLCDSTDDDESSPVISRTSGGNEHANILNDGEGSTFKVEPTNSATKKSQRNPKLKGKYLVLTFIPCILMSRSNLGPWPALRSKCSNQCLLIINRKSDRFPPL